jgi:hypothetical protein
MKGRTVLVLRRHSGGGFRQLPGRRGCLSADDNDGCRLTPILAGETPLWRLVIGHDGASAYLLSRGGATGLVSLHRDRTTGALRPVARDGCLSASVNAVGCIPVDGLSGEGQDIALSPNPRDVYVATDESVAHFRRGRNGGLHRVSAVDCFTRLRPGRCHHEATIPSPAGDAELYLTADGRNVYARFSGYGDLSTDGSSFGTLLEFSRDRVTGALAALRAPNGCVSPFPVGGCTGWAVLSWVIESLELVSPTNDSLACACERSRPASGVPI